METTEHLDVRKVERGTLSNMMEFDCVVQVLADGSVVKASTVFAPGLHDGELDQLPGDGWSLMDGYSGQDRYSGPIMHASEYVGGGMERDILANPGHYVTLVNYPTDDTEPEGWVVAYREVEA